MNTKIRRPLRILKRGFLAVSVITFASLDVSAAPLVQATFNDSSNLDLLNGAVLGAPGSGVSGQPGDRAYVAAAAEEPIPGESGPAAEIIDARTQENLEELTITCWYKPTTDLVAPMTLFTLGVGTLIWEPNSHWTLRLEGKPADGSDLRLMYWFGSSRDGAVRPWGESGSWIYFAAVWKKAEGTVTFYQGDREHAATQTNESVRDDDVMPLTGLENYKVIVGSNGGKMDRSFNGAIDNFRVFDKALSPEELNAIREGDL